MCCIPSLDSQLNASIWCLLGSCTIGTAATLFQQVFHSQMSKLLCLVSYRHYVRHGFGLMCHKWFHFILSPLKVGVFSKIAILKSVSLSHPTCEEWRGISLSAVQHQTNWGLQFSYRAVMTPYLPTFEEYVWGGVSAIKYRNIYYVLLDFNTYSMSMVCIEELQCRLIHTSSFHSDELKDVSDSSWQGQMSLHVIMFLCFNKYSPVFDDSKT